jgi:hypothetical protein
VNVVVKNGWFDRILGRPVWGEHFVFIPVGGDLGIDRVGMAYRGRNKKYSLTFLMVCVGQYMMLASVTRVSLILK